MALETSKLSLSTLSMTDGSCVDSNGSVQLISVSCLNVSSIPPVSPHYRGLTAPPSRVPDVSVLVHSAPSLGTVASSSTSASCSALASVSASMPASEKQLCPLPPSATPTDASASGDSDGGIGGGLREWLAASLSHGARQRYARGLLENWRLVVAYATPFVLLPWPLALRQPVRVQTMNNRFTH